MVATLPCFVSDNESRSTDEDEKSSSETSIHSGEELGVWQKTNFKVVRLHQMAPCLGELNVCKYLGTGVFN
jgi:hypothetical protein